MIEKNGATIESIGDKKEKEYLQKENHFLDELVRILSGGVRIEVVEFKRFIEALKVLKDNNSIGDFSKSTGSVAVFCIGATYRSPLLGELLNKLGFIFAMPETVRGAKIKKQFIDVLQTMEFTEKGIRPNSAREAVHTLILSIDLSDPSETNIVEILLLEIKAGLEKAQQREFSMNLLIVDAKDLNGGYEESRSLVQSVFPELQIRSFSNPF